MRVHGIFPAVVLLGALSIVLLAPNLRAADSPIDLGAARKAFADTRAASEADGGTLWGKPLYGPLLFVDPQTHFVVTNQKDGEGKLREVDGVFVGQLPETENVANTAYTWAGLRWTMVMWPLSTNRYSRARLLMHESFHRIQDELGLPGSNPANAHLDGMDGRLWLRLEWRALQEALIRSGDARRRAIEDALLFRTYRRSLIPKAADEENALEMNEGLAEYTGYKLCGWPGSILPDRAAVRLEQEERGTNFIRSFAYASGPAYGMLLDDAAPSWRAGLGEGRDVREVREVRAVRDVADSGSVAHSADFGRLLATALRVQLPDEPKRLADEARRRAQAYDFETVAAEEKQRADERAAAYAQDRSRFVEGPVLSIPLSPAVNYTFNPNGAMSFGENGTVYGSTRIVDRWGILEVSGGALMTRDGSGSITEVRVPAGTSPLARTGAGKTVERDGWTLSLNDGWMLIEAARTGDYTVKPEL